MYTEIQLLREINKELLTKSELLLKKFRKLLKIGNTELANLHFTEAVQVNNEIQKNNSTIIFLQDVEARYSQN